jgi:hypothetical protein
MKLMTDWLVLPQFRECYKWIRQILLILCWTDCVKKMNQNGKKMWTLDDDLNGGEGRASVLRRWELKTYNQRITEQLANKLFDSYCNGWLSSYGNVLTALMSICSKKC